MILNRAEFAELCAVSAREVGRWLGAGMPALEKGKKGKPVQIDTGPAISWLRTEGALEQLGGVGGEVFGTAEQRAELVREQTRRLRLANDATERELVSLADVQQFAEHVAVIFATQLDGLAGKLSRGDSTRRAEIFAHCRRIRQITADKLIAFAGGERGGT
jgi:phage terminase Nu1 subunit (DNA packaging protein)